MDGLGLEDVLEGDILLDNYTRHVTGQAIGEENSVPNNVLPGLPGRKQRKRAVDNSRQWPNGIIPYVFSPFLGKLLSLDVFSFPYFYYQEKMSLKQFMEL